MIASSPSGANINESAFDGFTQEQGVAVVGSSNVDLTYGVKRIPKVGETLFADSFDQQFGGKGANQAVCISKLSSKEAKVVFVTVVGNDAFGNQVKENFRANNLYNVDKNVRTVDSVSGQALIFVEKETGNNSIVLVGGSNEHLAPQMVDDSWDDIKQCKVLVCQNETPLNATYHALKRAKEEGMITIFNPAPAVNLLNLPTEIADLPKYVDYLIPNETEAPLIIGKEMSDAYVEDQSSVESLCREIKEKLSVSNVIITLGKRGCAALYNNENEQLIYTYVEGEVVDAVDSTGAGDAWVGSFSYFISCDIPVEESIKLANFIASITVQYKGAQMSYNSISQSTILKKFEL